MWKECVAAARSKLAYFIENLFLHIFQKNKKYQNAVCDYIILLWDGQKIDSFLMSLEDELQVM